MGFLAGFIGGVTLTSSVFYLSLSLHERNRLYQSALLRQQSLVLRGLYEPLPPAPEPTARTVIPGLGDRLKYRWNAELEAAVRKVQGFSWDQWRNVAEEKVAGAWVGAGEKVREVKDA